MGLFSKKEEVPEIPAAPSLPEMPARVPELKKALPGLPSFPENKSNNNLNQEIVKSAVNDTSEVNEVSVGVPTDLHFKEVHEGGSLIPPKPSSSIPKLPEQPPIVEQKKTIELTPLSETSKTKILEPIFIRIDKFQTAQKNFEEIKENVKEIELVLRKVKDLKAKENEEIEEWTQEIEKIKSRLSGIDKDVFSKV